MRIIDRYNCHYMLSAVFLQRITILFCRLYLALLLLSRHARSNQDQPSPIQHQPNRRLESNRSKTHAQLDPLPVHIVDCIVTSNTLLSTVAGESVDSEDDAYLLLLLRRNPSRIDPEYRSAKWITPESSNPLFSSSGIRRIDIPTPIVVFGGE